MQQKLIYLETLLGEETIKSYAKLSNLSFEERWEYIKYYPESAKDFELVSNCIHEMEHWGTNSWWESSDKRTLAYFQTMSDVLIIPFEKFHEALEELLNKTIPEMLVRYYPKSFREVARNAYLATA